MLLDCQDKRYLIIQKASDTAMEENFTVMEMFLNIISLMIRNTVKQNALIAMVILSNIPDIMDNRMERPKELSKMEI